MRTYAQGQEADLNMVFGLQVHDGSAKALEGRRVEDLGEDVSVIAVGRHKGDGDLHVLYHVAHEKVATENVLGLGVELRVVSQVASGLILSTPSGDGESAGHSLSSSRRRRSQMNSLEASDAATISASQVESATQSCRLEAHEITAEPRLKQRPEVELTVAQSASL